MTEFEFLRRICEGYVQCYRTLNLRTRQPWGDLTKRELDFLARLGQMLGFAVRTEEDNRMDLGWYDPDDITRPVVHIERETEGFSAVLEKLLNSRVDRLIAIFGCVSEQGTEEIRKQVCSRIGDRSMAVIAWVGPTKDKANCLWAFVCAQGKCFSRSGVGKIDDAQFWYAHFVGQWTEGPQVV